MPGDSRRTIFRSSRASDYSEPDALPRASAGKARQVGLTVADGGGSGCGRGLAVKGDQRWPARYLVLATFEHRARDARVGEELVAKRARSRDRVCGIETILR